MKKLRLLFCFLTIAFFAEYAQALPLQADTLTKAEFDKVALYGYYTYGGIYLEDSVTALLRFDGIRGEGYVYDWRGFALFTLEGSYSVNDRTWVMTATNMKEKVLGELRAEITTKSMIGFTLMFNPDKFNWKAIPNFTPLPTAVTVAGYHSPAGNDQEDPDFMLDFNLSTLAFDEQTDGAYASTFNMELIARYSPFIPQHGPYRNANDVKNQMQLAHRYFLSLYYQGVDSNLSLTKLREINAIHTGNYAAKTKLLYAQHDLLSFELIYNWSIDTTLNQVYARDGLVFQVSTGKKLALNDLFLPGFEKQLLALADRNKDTNFMEDEAVTLSTDFSIDGFGLHLYYSQGKIGNWQTQCYIPWKELEPLINPEGPLAFVVK
jgi:hypothetical protein